ncbi:transmembrane 220 family protein [Cellvibrio sp. UBA7671]|uniref:transmembrane 220 family protein n=1 Tax=Cellvibrio sp. UBA7671 TaxID=1946312 RepID=UPI002F35AFBD
MIYIAKSIAALFALTLLAFAALQFNDPDPMIWVSFYCLCAATPLLALANKFISPLFWLTLALCVLELVLTAPGAYNYYLHMEQEPLMQSMNPDKPYIEEAREFLGALIAVVLVCLSALLARYTVNNNK